MTFLVTFFAVELKAKECTAPILGQHPRAGLQRRVVADVPGVAAIQVGDPVTEFILVESDDPALHVSHVRMRPDAEAVVMSQRP